MKPRTALSTRKSTPLCPMGHVGSQLLLEAGSPAILFQAHRDEDMTMDLPASRRLVVEGKESDSQEAPARIFPEMEPARRAPHPRAWGRGELSWRLFYNLKKARSKGATKRTGGWARKPVEWGGERAA